MLAALLAGCGGAKNESSLEAAAERTEAQGTGRFEVDGTRKSKDEPVPYECTGEADYGSKRVHVACKYTRAGDLDAIAIGADSFVRGPVLGAGTDKWVHLGGEEDDDALASLSPHKLLRLLRGASQETERIGEEAIRGVSTVGYRLIVECDAASLNCRSTTPVEVWIGDDGVVRRIDLEDDVGKATYEFFDFGTAVDIQPPPGEDVVEEDEVYGSESGVGESGEETHP